MEEEEVVVAVLVVAEVEEGSEESDSTGGLVGRLTTLLLFTTLFDVLEGGAGGGEGVGGEWKDDELDDEGAKAFPARCGVSVHDSAEETLAETMGVEWTFCSRALFAVFENGGEDDVEGDDVEGDVDGPGEDRELE